MLTRHVTRLGGTPSRATGAFYDKVVALDSPADRLALVNRGQGWVVRRLREALGRIADGALQSDLEDMLQVHESNIARCNALGSGRRLSASRCGRTPGPRGPALLGLAHISIPLFEVVNPAQRAHPHSVCPPRERTTAA